MHRLVMLLPLLAGCQIDTLRTPIDTADLGAVSIRDLCANYANTKDTGVRAELVRRSAFSDAEWQQIGRGQIKPTGYREPVLWCAWGLPGDHGEIVATSSGSTRYRYDFAGLSWDIIVKDGVVTSFDVR